MIAGALAVSTAVASERENSSTHAALLRECKRYGLDYDRVVASYGGSVEETGGRAWWDYGIVAAAVGVFAYLGANARVPELGMDVRWVAVLAAILVGAAVLSGWGLWRATRFS
jgi:hypothetical protein